MCNIMFSIIWHWLSFVLQTVGGNANCNEDNDVTFSRSTAIRLAFALTIPVRTTRSGSGCCSSSTVQITSLYSSTLVLRRTRYWNAFGEKDVSYACLLQSAASILSIAGAGGLFVSCVPDAILAVLDFAHSACPDAVSHIANIAQSRGVA